ncbi:MAG: recombination mediator RecR [Firmicutes bacterium]|nr:recombination mediator RecR [Bacillota bacterium]
MDELTRLIACFRKLPAVGYKTAERYAYAVIGMNEADAGLFSQAILEAKEKIRFCKECGNYSTAEVCKKCTEADKTVICVVEHPKDILAFEKTGAFHGVYHVLHGSLDFQKGVSPEHIRIKELLTRLNGVKEVIVATNPDISGEMTATYLAQLLKPLGVSATRIAHGIPMGSEIEYADELTLARALQDRRPL